MGKAVGKMRALIDTCVLIDFATGRDEQLLDNANIILSQSYLKSFDGFITSSSITDIYYILHRYCHSSEEAKEYLEKLLDYVSILDVTDSDCRKAINSDVPDFEDAVLAECAIRNKMDYIITDNLKDFSKSSVPAIGSNDFICKIS